MGHSKDAEDDKRRSNRPPRSEYAEEEFKIIAS